MLSDVALLRQQLPDMGAEPAHDALLKRYIAAAAAMFQKETGKVFEATTDTTHTLSAVDDVDGAVLYLRSKLASITSVVNGDAVVVTAGQYIPVPSVPPYTALMLRPTAGITWTYTLDPTTAISVTGKWADYATPPDDVKLAVTNLAAWLYKRRDNMGMGDQTQATVSQSGLIQLPAVMPLDVQTVADRYTSKPGAGSHVVRGKLVTP